MEIALFLGLVNDLNLQQLENIYTAISSNFSYSFMQQTANEICCRDSFISQLDYGSISANYGSISEDYGSILADYGSISADYGSISADYGSISADYGSISANSI